jgi:KaiC/GvpD/RAD55 family RecA-like ATPase
MRKITMTAIYCASRDSVELFEVSETDRKQGKLHSTVGAFGKNIIKFLETSKAMKYKCMFWEADSPQEMEFALDKLSNMYTYDVYNALKDKVEEDCDLELDDETEMRFCKPMEQIVKGTIAFELKEEKEGMERSE